MSVRAGMDVKQLLERHIDVAMGALFPLSRTGDERQRQQAKDVLEGGIYATTLDGVPRACSECMPALHTKLPLNRPVSAFPV